MDWIIVTVKYVEFICQGCNQLKLPMEMHNDKTCKNCWLREYKSKFKNRTTKMIETKKLKAKLLLGSG